MYKLDVLISVFEFYNKFESIEEKKSDIFKFSLINFLLDALEKFTMTFSFYNRVKYI